MHPFSFGTGFVGRPLSKHTLMQRYPRDTKTGDAPRHWRWRGFITDYYTAESVLRENPSAGNPTTASHDGSQGSASKQTTPHLPQHPAVPPPPPPSPPSHPPPLKPSFPPLSTFDTCSPVTCRCASSTLVLCHAVSQVSTAYSSNHMHWDTHTLHSLASSCT